MDKEDVLNCFHGIPERDLSYWAGHSAFLRMYYTASGTARDALIAAVGEIIKEENDWQIVADLLHLAAVLRMNALSPQVAHLRVSGRFADQPIVQEMLEYCKNVL